MGTPEFAVPTLSAIHDAGHEIDCVITQPDRARDRGKKKKYTPVKEKALEYGIEVLQPEKVKGNEELLEEISSRRPDVIVVVAYGKILPRELIDIPKYGCVNVHASLLPKHRGAAPIQRSIIEGDKVTGVTIMYIEEALDSGDMLAKTEVEIGSMNAVQLAEVLSEKGADLLVETLEKIENGTVRAVAQNDAEATYAPMIYKKDGLIDFADPPEVICNMVRGMYPWPGAYTYYNEEIFKIWQASAVDKECPLPPGTAAGSDGSGILISAGGKILCAEVVQVPGKKRMPAKEFLKGHSIETGAVFGGKSDRS